MKLANPELNVVVFSGDGDLFAIGGNHFIHAARRNVDLTIICVNNFNYGMTGGQVAATTPLSAKTTTTPVGNPDTPFNLPLLAYASGATYVARWTILHTRDLTESIEEALLNRGFSFVEVLSPCPVNYGRRNKENGIDSLKIYQERTIIRNDAQPWELDIDFDRGIVLGKFIETERPTCTDRYDNTCRPKELIEDEKGLE
jgi:2-oxoglutarate ferredoxin oxidoreductase subunit beta